MKSIDLGPSRCCKALGIDNNTLLVFASDNGPWGEPAREYGNLGTPDMGNSGPFRGTLGDATEGSIRTFCFIRWPGHIRPGTTSYAMFSIMDFFPTFAHLIGTTVTTDRPIDGVDQTEVLLGQSEVGHRDSLLTFIGASLVAARWKQWRVYFNDMQPTGLGPQRLAGLYSNLAGMSTPMEEVKKYEESVKKYPNSPAPSMTNVHGGG
jgi:arylsulfatase